MSVGAVNKQTGDRIPTAGMPAIDNALSATSTNPVQNAIITAALANKQDKTDNALQTTDKTVVGAINEHEGDISSLMSGLTNLDTEVNGDATTYPYADVITIEDAVPSNLADCSVKIEPVQDLHGYDHPWVGGAGKNKCNPTGTSTTYGDYSVTKNTDGSYTVTGGGTGEQVIAILAGEFTAKANTEYHLNGCPTGGGSGTYRLDVRSDGATIYKNVSDNGSGATFTADEDATLYVYMRFGRGYAITGSVTFYPMICLVSETDKSFAPYTNICPISGHTDVDVQRDGVNIFGGNSTSNPQYVGNYYINGAQYNWSKSANAEHNCFDVEVFPSTSYRMVRGAVLSTVGQLRFLDRNKEFISGATLNPNVDNAEIVTPSNCKYIEFATSKTSQYYISINYPSTDTNVYTEWNRQTYTIALGSTIYGGTVDFDSGVMTVDRAVVVLDGTNNAVSGASASQSDPNLVQAEWTGYRSIGVENATFIADKLETVTQSERKPHSIYSSTSAVRMYIGFLASEASTNEECNTWLSNNNVTVCYPLATPTTIQLTPQQIQLLKGQNTLTASTGQISVTVNGVSGAIGQVQEQVNELTEEVTKVNSFTGTTSETGVLSPSPSISAEEYFVVSAFGSNSRGAIPIVAASDNTWRFIILQANKVTPAIDDPVTVTYALVKRRV